MSNFPLNSKGNLLWLANEPQSVTTAAQDEGPLTFRSRAHIPDDRSPLRRPSCPEAEAHERNPLSKIHQAAFDAHLIGIDPDFRIHVSDRLLGQNDGPILETLKQLNGRNICLPRVTDILTRIDYASPSEVMPRGRLAGKRAATGLSIAPARRVRPWICVPLFGAITCTLDGPRSLSDESDPG